MLPHRAARERFTSAKRTQKRCQPPNMGNIGMPRRPVSRDLVAGSFFSFFYPVLNHHVHLHACVTDGVLMPAAAAPAGDAPLALLPAWSSCRRFLEGLESRSWPPMCLSRKGPENRVLPDQGTSSVRFSRGAAEETGRGKAVAVRGDFSCVPDLAVGRDSNVSNSRAAR